VATRASNDNDGAQVEQLLSEVAARRYSRRQALGRGIALGMSNPAIEAVLASPVVAQDASSSPAAGGPVDVPIVGKKMSFADIKAAVGTEKEVVVGNWTYTANDQLVKRFQDYVKGVYGEDVKLSYQATQEPSTYLTNLYAALSAGDNAPYDVLAIEEAYWADAKSQSQPVMENYLPSGLIPNADRILDMFKHYPTSIGFQASATPAVVYDKSRVDYLTDWTDLSNPKLKGKLTMPLPGDITCGGFLLGIAGALGKDYHDPNQMKQAIDYVVDSIGPNVLKYTTDSATMQQLLRSGVVDAVGFWNSLARLEYLSGQKNTVMMIAKSGQYLINGYTWIPKKPKHPVLSQIFIDWRLSDDGQFPDLAAWGIQEGPWSELQEGLMGPSYVKDIPAWFKDQYYTYYPTLDQLTTQYKLIDWAYYAAHEKEWMDYYSGRLGQ
jgi:spermidine/putrescine-binding protein